MADIKQIKVGNTTYNIEPVTSYYKTGCSNFEMNDSGSLKGYGGFIDFHFFNFSGQPLNSSGSVVSSTPDYTSRIIEDSAGCIDINGTYIAWTGLTSGYIKSNGSIDATTFNENGTSLADKYAAKSHNHDGRYLRWTGSAANADAMGWGTLTANNGYNILSHASSSDGGDWGMVNKDGKIFMQLDGYYYQNEGQYRVLDTSDSSSFATAGHTHDDRYYTESEIDSKLSGKSNTNHTHNYLPLSGGTMDGTLIFSKDSNGIKFASNAWYITNIEAGTTQVQIGTAAAGYTTSVTVTFKDYKHGSGSWYVVATAAGNNPAQPECVIVGISDLTGSGVKIRVRKIANNSSSGNPAWNINWIAIKYW